jgi:hypothetical protein
MKPVVAVGITVMMVSALYALLASLPTSPLWPAAPLIQIQAHESHEYYGKITFVATWLVCVAIGFLGVSAITVVVRAFAACGRLVTGQPFHDVEPVPSGREWRALRSASRWTKSCAGFALFLVTLIVLRPFLFAPSSVWSLGVVALFVVGPAAVANVFGQIMLLDGVLLPRSFRGFIERIEPDTDASGQVLSYIVRVRGTEWRLPPELALDLRGGDELVVHTAFVTGSPFELHMRR